MRVDSTAGARGVVERAREARSGSLTITIGTGCCDSTAPFLYEWGAAIARHPQLAPEDVGEIAEALVDGWEILQKGPLSSPVGYARALAGIEEHVSGGLSTLESNLPSRIAKKLKTGTLRTLITVPETRWKQQWERATTRFLKGR